MLSRTPQIQCGRKRKINRELKCINVVITQQRQTCIGVITFTWTPVHESRAAIYDFSRSLLIRHLPSTSTPADQGGCCCFEPNRPTLIVVGAVPFTVFSACGFIYFLSLLKHPFYSVLYIFFYDIIFSRKNIINWGMENVKTLCF